MDGEAMVRGGWRSSLAPMLLALALTGLFTACGGGGESNNSSTSAAPTPPVASVPPAPTISGVQAADGSATFTVNSSASNLTRYTVNCNAGAVAKTNSGSSASISLTGLVNGTAYSCTATVTNAAGTSPSSTAVNVTPVGASTVAFKGDVVLGSPTADSIKVNVYSASQSGSVTLAYGTLANQLLPHGAEGSQCFWDHCCGAPGLD